MEPSDKVEYILLASIFCHKTWQAKSNPYQTTHFFYISKSPFQRKGNVLRLTSSYDALIQITFLI